MTMEGRGREGEKEEEGIIPGLQTESLKFVSSPQAVHKAEDERKEILTQLGQAHVDLCQ